MSESAFVPRMQLDGKRSHLVPRSREERPVTYLPAHEGARYAFTRGICGEPCRGGVPKPEELQDPAVEHCGACDAIANGELARATG